MNVDRSVYIPSAVVLLAGLWLLASPWILGEVPNVQPGVLSVVVSGLLIALLAAGNLWATVGSRGSRVLGWIIAALGAWVTAAPFVFGYAGNTPWTWSSVISGVIVAALGVVDATTRALASVEPSLRERVHGPWVGGQHYPAFAFEWEDHPLWALGLAERSGSGRAAADGQFRGVGPRNWRRQDEQILADVCERMAAHPRLDARDIDVVVASGEVKLEGVVPSRVARRLAEAIADTVNGVRDVDNQLRVRESRGEVRRAA
jgi:hypothetical protein